MRKRLAVLAGIVVAIALSACGHTGQLQSVSANPQVQQDQKAAEQIVQGCLSKGNFLTHDGRLAIVHCIAPAGHEAAFQACASRALAHSGFLTKRQRAHLLQGLVVCLEKNR